MKNRRVGQVTPSVDSMHDLVDLPRVMEAVAQPEKSCLKVWIVRSRMQVAQSTGRIDDPHSRESCVIQSRLRQVGNHSFDRTARKNLIRVEDNKPYIGVVGVTPPDVVHIDLPLSRIVFGPRRINYCRAMLSGDCLSLVGRTAIDKEELIHILSQASKR